MIKVTMELLPASKPGTTEPLGHAVIYNLGTGDEKTGNYAVQLFSKGKSPRPYRTGQVREFPRRRLNAWDLLYRALKETVGDRNLVNNALPIDVCPLCLESCDADAEEIWAHEVEGSLDEKTTNQLYHARCIFEDVYSLEVDDDESPLQPAALELKAAAERYFREVRRLLALKNSGALRKDRQPT